MKQTVFATFPLSDRKERSENWHRFDRPGVAVQFQGTLYNSEALGHMLQLEPEAKPHALFAYGYRRWGEKLFEKIEGIFAVVIDDMQQGRVIAVRDTIGIAPLYYRYTEGKLTLSSSLSRLADMKGYRKTLHIEALANYFTYGFIMQPNTIYRECYRAEAGTLLLYDKQSGNLTKKCYWSLGEHYNTPKRPPDREEILQRSRALLEASVRKRLAHSSGRVALSLSSGYDSATIAALVQAAHSEPIHTFTIGFEDKRLDEAPDAAKIAAHLGTRHTEYYFSKNDAIEAVTSLCEFYDEPFYNNGAIPTTILAGLASEAGIGTIFVGDGGDEVFATADDVERFGRIATIPYPLRRGLCGIAQKLRPHALPWLKSYRNFPTKYYKMVEIFRSRSIPQMVRHKMRLFDPYELGMLLSEEHITFPTIFDTIAFGPHAEPVDLITGSYFQSFMLDGELMKTVGAFSHVSIAVREPFLDRELIAFMAEVPASVKIRNGVKKYLLKEIAHDYIPKKLLDRPKRGFSIPFDNWMRGILKPLVTETLSQESLRIDGILDAAYVKKISDLFFSGNDAYKYKLWSIFLYQLWYEKRMR